MPARSGSQSAAKNCITVGASESNRPKFEPSYGTYWPSDFPSDPIKSDRQANDPDGMVAFSSRGPTKEKRFKPDVVAPGTCILSTLSRDVASPSTDFGTSSDSLFFFDSGTSMATPLVAGCAAVLRETLVKNGTATPSAALIKALLVNGAVRVPGQYSPTEAGTSPNNNSGWGRVDLAGAVIIPDFARLQRDSATSETAAALLSLVYRLDVRDQLPLVRAPTLVVHRRDDRAVPYRLGREVAATIPSAVFVPLQGSAHFPWHGDAESVIRACREMLAPAQRSSHEASGPQRVLRSSWENE